MIDIGVGLAFIPRGGVAAAPPRPCCERAFLRTHVWRDRGSGGPSVVEARFRIG